MAKMDGVVISNEFVKPSSPTPQHLRTHRLSLLDRLASPTLVPIVLYFPHINETDPDSFISRTTLSLKRSLSLTLTRFYPLAGRVNADRKSIDCNDEGVPFAVVKFPCHKLSDLLINPDPNLPSSFLPCTDSYQCPNSALALMQVNYFDCGGVAIGAFFSHITVDAGTMASFLNSWSETTRGSALPVSPDYTAQSMFPQVEGVSYDTPIRVISSGAVRMTGKPVLRRYRFDATAISSLKAKSGVARPSRVEVLAALFWRCYMVASLANKHSVSLVAQFVDLRRRARPVLPPDSFGNFPVPAAAASRNEIGVGMVELVNKLRDSVSMIDGDLVNRMRGDEGVPALIEMLVRQRNAAGAGVNVDVLSITSWCGFGLDRVEFGWGKPGWVTGGGNNHSGSAFFNHVVLVDTGEGVEAWVVLDEKYMAVFDGDEDLRALASTDPSPLHS